MKTCAAATAIALLVGSALSAQKPAASTQPQPSPPTDGSTVTVTGCLRAVEPPGTFVLDRATWRPTDRPSKDGVDAGQRATPAAGGTLRLAGATTRLKLGDHAGHTVTLTGTLAPQDPIVRPAIVLPDQPAGDTTSRTPQREEKPSPRVINVRTITHVAEGCG